LKSWAVLSEAFPNCPIVSTNLKITFVHRRFYASMKNFKLDLCMLRRTPG
jgi:hypothetical protein